MLTTILQRICHIGSARAYYVNTARCKKIYSLCGQNNDTLIFSRVKSASEIRGLSSLAPHMMRASNMLICFCMRRASVKCQKNTLRQSPSSFVCSTRYSFRMRHHRMQVLATKLQPIFQKRNKKQNDYAERAAEQNTKQKQIAAAEQSARRARESLVCS